jgi:hypothetical protein
MVAMFKRNVRNVSICISIANIAKTSRTLRSFLQPIHAAIDPVFQAGRIEVDQQTKPSSRQL